MQGIVFDIKRFAVHDGPGIRTTVFLKGCPLNCSWCHNPESIEMMPVNSIRKIKLDSMVYHQTEEVGKYMTVKEVIDTIKKDYVFMEESEGGVTFSGGEPTMQSDFLLQLLQMCKIEDIHTTVDTCGYCSQTTIHEISPFTDLFLFDLKHYEPKKHMALTGKSNDIILQNLIYILKERKKIRIRIPVIPEFNDTPDELTQMAQLLKSLNGSIDRVDLLPFHAAATNKYQRFGMVNHMEGIKGLQKQDLETAKSIFESAGYRVKIGG